MALTSLPFVLSQFETERYRYYVVKDEDGSLVLSQNDVIDPGLALQKLKNFLSHNYGGFTIEVFPQKLSSVRSLAEHDRKRIAMYKIDVVQEALPQGVGGLAGMQGYGFGSLPPDDPRANAPNMFQVLGQLSNVEMQMKLMEKDHQNYIEKRELLDRIAKMEEERSKDRGYTGLIERIQPHIGQIVMGLMTVAGEYFNKQPQHVTPMNGIGTEIDQQVAKNVQTAQTNDRQAAVVDAVNRLIQHDPNFPENIAKLAALAQRNPGIYKMAVQYLKTL